MSNDPDVGDGEEGGAEAVPTIDNGSRLGDVEHSGVPKSSRIPETVLRMLLVLDEAVSTRALRALGRNLLKNRDAVAFCVVDLSSRM
jgi:hypothetical protein